ncbi:MAG TPA: triose-phosphate isomerase [Lacunisphaera sp.]|jgi:triosephosphate isomerase|nr:triose-phosphate isomerase [Lacunisphaera sp.]HQY06306.1 triose-phosphate isomerase [Lacunisphaera sp.]
MFRKKVIAGNWKMNKTATEAVTLAKDIIDEVGRETSVDIVLCPPFTALSAVAHVLEGQAVKLGGQNMHPAKNGAYTGEISAEMLRTLYATHVILGHSERRTYFCETDAFINQKVVTALAHELKPILCVGETLAEREAGATLAVVQRHVEGGLSGVKPEQITTVIIAYEPVWAIGTGKVATTAQAQEVHAFIRDLLTKLYGAPLAQKVRILYGGSMKPANAAELLAEKDIDGGLIGGASLEAKSFIDLVKAADAVK